MSEQKKYRVLVVIPAFKESRRLPLFLNELTEVIKNTSAGIDILVVDDGSGKKEQDIICKNVLGFQDKFAFVLNPILLESNIGKGGAILAGWDYAKDYDCLAFVDADGAVPAMEVKRLADLLSTEHRGESIFGARIKMLGKKINRGWIRHLSGRIFSFIVGVMVEPDIYDSQCGLKFIKKEAYMAIRNRLKGRRFAFDVELIAALKSARYPVVEVPISWRDVPGSKVSIFKDTMYMTISVIQIRKEMKQWM